MPHCNLALQCRDDRGGVAGGGRRDERGGGAPVGRRRRHPGGRQGAALQTSRPFNIAHRPGLQRLSPRGARRAPTTSSSPTWRRPRTATSSASMTPRLTTSPTWPTKSTTRSSPDADARSKCSGPTSPGTSSVASTPGFFIDLKVAIWFVNEYFCSWFHPRGTEDPEGIWRIVVPPKIHLLLWLLSYNNLARVDNLNKKGLKKNTQCCPCNENESISHLFFDRVMAKVIWKHVSDFFWILRLEMITCQLHLSGSTRRNFTV
jgi:hypothetical protein